MQCSFLLMFPHLQEAMHEVIHFEESREGVHACVALQWCSDSYSDTLMGYVNSIRTTDGGSHVDGLRSAVARAVNSAARAQKLIRVRRMADHGRGRPGLILDISIVASSCFQQIFCAVCSTNKLIRKFSTAPLRLTAPLPVHRAGCVCCTHFVHNGYCPSIYLVTSRPVSPPCLLV